MQDDARARQEADAAKYGPGMVLCPKCEMTIGHAEATVIAKVVWHTACVAVELMKRTPIVWRVELAARLQSAPPGPSRLVIDDADGFRMVLDALTRYLADKPLETLRTIVSLLNGVPHSAFPSVNLGSGSEGVDLLTSLDARVRTFPSSEGHPLTYAILEIEGVDITAVYPDRGGT